MSGRNVTALQPDPSSSWTVAAAGYRGTTCENMYTYMYFLSLSPPPLSLSLSLRHPLPTHQQCGSDLCPSLWPWRESPGLSSVCSRQPVATTTNKLSQNINNYSLLWSSTVKGTGKTRYFIKLVDQKVCHECHAVCTDQNVRAEWPVSHHMLGGRCVLYCTNTTMSCMYVLLRACIMYCMLQATCICTCTCTCAYLH